MSVGSGGHVGSRVPARPLSQQRKQCDDYGLPNCGTAVINQLGQPALKRAATLRGCAANDVGTVHWGGSMRGLAWPD
jgi:hypothetical protein